MLALPVDIGGKNKSITLEDMSSKNVVVSGVSQIDVLKRCITPIWG